MPLNKKLNQIFTLYTTAFGAGANYAIYKVNLVPYNKLLLEQIITVLIILWFHVFLSNTNDYSMSKIYFYLIIVICSYTVT